MDDVDTRLTRLAITGQEILSRDKVTLRINFVCNYKITDYSKVLAEIDDYEEQLHLAAQLILRESIGKLPIDEISIQVLASTRSLLNAAKLMDENQTLYKLKKLEYLERICENVGIFRSMAT